MVPEWNFESPTSTSVLVDQGSTLPGVGRWAKVSGLRCHYSRHPHFGEVVGEAEVLKKVNCKEGHVVRPCLHELQRLAGQSIFLRSKET